MREFVCPKCKKKTIALAKEVGHRCTYNQNKWVNFVEVPKEEEEK